MTRFSGENRRPSTVVRDNSVHQAYHELCKEAGKLSPFVAKSYIYDHILGASGQSGSFILPLALSYL